MGVAVCLLTKFQDKISIDISFADSKFQICLQGGYCNPAW